MKKMKLNLDHLKVESFDTEKLVKEKGTINGLRSPGPGPSDYTLCSCEVWQNTCAGTCEDSCLHKTCDPRLCDEWK